MPLWTLTKRYVLLPQLATSHFCTSLPSGASMQGRVLSESVSASTRQTPSCRLMAVLEARIW